MCRASAAPSKAARPQHILAEARQLADEGCQEITLLGQTVNSYTYREGERTTRFSDLLDALHDIDGLERIKFVTNYPKDMTDDLLAAVRDLPKCAKYLHVPAQSGSDAACSSAMKRGYTVAEYREMLARILRVDSRGGGDQRLYRRLLRRDRRGFSAGRCDLVRECAIQEQLYLQVQRAPRHQGRRAVLPDDVPDEVKRARNNELLALQNEISEDDNQRFLGDRVEVLVEGPSKAAEKRSDEGPVDAAHRPHDVRSHRGVRRQPPADRRDHRHRHLRRECPYAVRHGGHATRRAGVGDAGVAPVPHHEPHARRARRFDECHNIVALAGESASRQAIADKLLQFTRISCHGCMDIGIGAMGRVVG